MVFGESPMITVLLKGGLGNQMFQYALGKSLAIEKDDELTLDLSFLKCRIPIEGFTYRDYELDLFEIDDRTTTFARNDLIDKYLSYPIQKIINKVANSGYVEQPNGGTYDYLPHLFESNQKDLFIEGYWNNYKYFEKHNSEILKIFDSDKLKDGNSKFLGLEKEINDTNSVSINIRRGDYLNSKYKDVYVHLDEQYYRKGIEIIRKKVKNPKFFVFSYDDPDWIKTALEFNEDELFIVGKDYVGDRFKTYLRLISLCKHNIISNSTFAFWGVYMNKNSNKVVVCPKKWMNVVASDFQTPQDWMKV